MPYRRALVVLAALAGVAARVANKPRPTPCSATPCRTGLCAFEDCETPTSCPGGRCTFTRCFAPECGGGSCAFTQSYAPVCGGGSCTETRSYAKGQEDRFLSALREAVAKRGTPAPAPRPRPRPRPTTIRDRAPHRRDGSLLMPPEPKRLAKPLGGADSGFGRADFSLDGSWVQA